MIAPEEGRAALDRVLASETFARADRLSRFLRFVVERTLVGEAAELKEYLIGTEVFDRSADFDPRLDPIVRVEARRLRAKLQEYYEGPGHADPVRIDLPKGAYSAVFKSPAGPAIVSRRFTWRWAAVLVLAAAGAAAGVVALRPSDPPALAVAVLPFGEQPYADLLGEAISAELARYSEARVIAYRRVLEFRERQGSLSVENARDLQADAVVAISVQRADNRRRITATLMLPEHGWKRWAGEYERGVGDDFAVQREVARAIAEELRGRLVR